MYDGTGNIEGFFCFFNWWCASGHLSADDSPTLLCGAVRGEACDHLGNSRMLAKGGTYEEVKSNLITTFGCQEAKNLTNGPRMLQ